MPGPRLHAPPAEEVAAWLADLGLEPAAPVERDSVVAWDLVLDGRRRRDLRVTLILDPAVGAIAWAHLAPPVLGVLRKAYRQLLGWTDDFPFAKFSVTDDNRPILAVEVPLRWLDVEELGLALARVVTVADALFEETRGWLWIGGRVPDGYADRQPRNERLLERYAGRLGELVAEVPGPDRLGAGAREAS